MNADGIGGAAGHSLEITVNCGVTPRWCLDCRLGVTYGTTVFIETRAETSVRDGIDFLESIKAVVKNAKLPAGLSAAPKPAVRQLLPLQLGLRDRFAQAPFRRRQRCKVRSKPRAIRLVIASSSSAF